MSYQREFENSLKVGVIGLGFHSYRNLLPAFHYLPVRLEAFCDLNEELLRKTARQFGVQHCFTQTEDMYENTDLDAVFICVGPYHHPQLATEAFQHGVHAWMEKPAASSSESVKNMLKERGDLVSVVGYKKAFTPALSKVREILSQPDAGKLKTILGAYPVWISKDPFELIEKKEMFRWLADCSHPLSVLLEIGGEVEAVTTILSDAGEGICALEFKNGAIGNLHMCPSASQAQEMYRFTTDQVNVTIDNGLAVTLNQKTTSAYGRTTNYAPEGMDHGFQTWFPQNCLASLENKALFTQGFYDEMMHFCDCILNQRSVEHGSLEFALKLTQVSEAAMASQGKRIQLN